jgi:AraC-like DNA-binding protein
MPSAIPGAVAWTSTAFPDDPVTRVLPDGCLDLIWFGDRLLVAGPDTFAHLVEAPAAERTIAGLRFEPGVGPTVLGIPASELRDRRIPLAALWPGAEVRRLEERFAAGGLKPALEAVAAERLRRGGPPDAMTTWIAGRLRTGQAVAEVADAVGLSERQLHRRSLAAFGYGPKTLARVLRMNRALALARAGTAFADVAHSVGYADQAHLAREVKNLAGVPLSELTT